MKQFNFAEDVVSTEITVTDGFGDGGLGILQGSSFTTSSLSVAQKSYYYNLQYYPPGGGFKTWHSERINPIASKRVFVFMTYLNDVEDGGTDFYYQKLTTPAKKGLTLIWPTDFTHTHSGQISDTHEKYIITGWFGYN